MLLLRIRCGVRSLATALEATTRSRRSVPAANLEAPAYQIDRESGGKTAALHISARRARVGISFAHPVRIWAGAVLRSRCGSESCLNQ